MLFFDMARKGQPITLSKEHLTVRTTNSRALSKDHRLVIRSRIMLLLADGSSYDHVQEELGVGREAIAKWKKRFLGSGPDGLIDSPRPGKPAIYGEADKARVKQLACSKPSGGYTNWSQRRIASKLGMSQRTVQKILREDDLRPHKVEYWCGKSTDPEFEAKMLNVVGLYLTPPKKCP